MSYLRNFRPWRWIVAAGLIGGLSWGAGPITRAEEPAPETATTVRDADRYLTALSTDKPIYRESENVYIRGVLLQAFTHKPLDANKNVQAKVEIRDPKGVVVMSGFSQAAQGVLGTAWAIPEGQAGGEYTLTVSWPWAGYPPAERKFDVRAYRTPRLKTDIVFLRDGYAPGDAVTATLQVSRAEGGIPAGAKVTAQALVDGVTVATEPLTVDAQGRCTTHFTLPKAIVSGDGTLAMTIEDGGVVESAGKTIPIILNVVDLQLYPEGGDLVEGLPGEVYFEARRKNGKPADLAGEVLNAAGVAVAQFRSVHEGRGSFVIPHVEAGAYTLKITEPAGVTTTATLPKAQAKGIVLHAAKEIYASDEPIELWLGNTQAGAVEIRLSKRAVKLTDLFLMAGAPEKVKAGPWQGCAIATLKPPTEFDGVLTATVFDENHKPLAERLIYRQPKQALDVSVKADATQYVPGGHAKLIVKTTVGGQPVSATVGLTVSDDSVTGMLEKRDRPPRLTAMAFLEPEVQDLADTEIYLADNTAPSTKALDLLLGTQGWRRFALVDAAAFEKTQGDKAVRVLAVNHPTPPPPPVMDEAMPMMAMAGGARNADDGPAAPGGVALPAPAPAPMEKPGHDGDMAQKQGGKRPQIALGAQGRIQANQPKQADAKKADRRDRMRAAREINEQEGQSAVYVREYAHHAVPAKAQAERTDFTETVYWTAGVTTDVKTGEAVVNFDLSDAVTTFHVFADGVSTGGALGGSTISLESVKPFYIEPKMPLELTAGDTVQLPVSFVNGTASPLPGIQFTAESDDLATFTPGPAQELDLTANGRERKIIFLVTGTKFGIQTLTFRGDAGLYKDSVTRSVTIKPLGFPLEISRGGTLAANSKADHSVTIPEEYIPGSVKSKVVLYATPLGNMNQALERLIQEPYGCFEQTSSTSYPMTMAQQYFLSHTNVNPAAVEDARAKLDASYKRLTGFECSAKGYEWFGESPGHEALTAFGLLHFKDMAEVREVDASMVDRTKAWLMSQRDGKGGFNRNRRALHTWIEDKDCSNGYILWALLECGATGLDKEIASLKDAATASDNSYVWALGANALELGGDKATAQSLMKKLADRQNDKGEVAGSVPGATASIVGSRGDTLNIEATALAVLAWLREPAFAANAEKSVEFLNEACKGGRYGSTQSTVLALKAIIAHDKARAHPKVPGAVQLFVDGKPAGAPVAFTADTQGAIEMPEIGAFLTAGKHTVSLKMQDGCELPYCMTVTCVSAKPDSAADCRLELTTNLSSDKLQEGAAADVQVTVKNHSDKLAASPVAIVGIPAGLEPRHDQLKELVKAGSIDAYEVRGREVVLYWRSLTAGQEVKLSISVLAAVPGKYTAPASRVYEYYVDDQKAWVSGLTATITPIAAK
ncbi:MAG TPA: MG2 domain-containing protein [Planctomycetota bacterium]|nr:MG2 domain-containing protein [Planctomycetota bacterium]